MKSIRLISETISSQQKYAKVGVLVEDLKINDLIQDVITMQKQMTDNEFIQLETDFTTNIELQLDRLKLYQILTNIIVNARQALVNNPKNNRKIIIATAIKEPHLLIKIKDNGEGISEENQKKIFNHGFTTKKEGHGFGLHSCANYLKEMKGDLKLESDNQSEERYTQFTIILPL